jgi:hypothetical protein
MADRDEISEIDGFASILAVRHAKRRAVRQSAQQQKPGQSTKPPQQHLTRQDPTMVEAQQGIIARIAHSINPTRFAVVCYECQYSFPMTGRLRETLCPKCRTRLQAGDFVVDKEWFHPVRTIGTVEIIPGGVLRSVEVVARDIILAGSAEFGAINACRLLELWPGARFDITRMKLTDLIVRAGGDFIFSQPVTCRDVEIEGTLNAALSASGSVVIRAGGVLKGEVDCTHLIVEEGAGLDAEVRAGTTSTTPATPLSDRGATHRHFGLPGRN